MVQRYTRTTRAELRMLVGLAIVPPTAVLIGLVAYDALFFSGLFPGGAPIDSLDSAASLGMGIGILALVMTVFGALPAVAWLSRRQAPSLRNLLLIGGALGNLPFLLSVGGIVATHLMRGTLSSDIGRYWNGLSGAAVRTVMGLVCGMGAAAVFWGVVVRGTTGTVAGVRTSR
jgi:hypothetical protein